jgi:two-component system chemotaxis sensor kinase CheA
MLNDADILAQVLAAFRAEQAEHRQAAGELLLELERDPLHPERKSLLNQLFREAHSLKGGARAAGLLPIEQLAHRVEDLFAAARDGNLELTPTVCDPIYAVLDAIGALMARHDADEVLDLAPYQPLLDMLATLTESAPRAGLTTIDGSPGARSNGSLPRASASTHELAEPTSAVRRESAPPAAVAHHDDTATVRLPTAVLDGLLNEASELMTSTLRARQLVRDTAALAELPARWRRTWQRLRPSLARLRTDPSIQPIVHHLDDHASPEMRLATQAAKLSVSQEPLLDALEQANALMGELSQAVARLSRQVSEDHNRLAAVTDRLHDQVRRTRMLPLATLAPPLRLQLREMARAAGKRAALSVDDGGAEADRQVLEQLREVLLHLLRNAVDHGIEAPSLRAAAGKPETGVISLCASVSGDHLTLTLSDDGHGVDIAAVRNRAVAAGLISAHAATRVKTADLLDMIFLPGFSTSHVVNEISGRGVGLDVVRTHVERMQGRVQVESQPGQGTRFTITAPLSRTRSHGLLLRAGGGEYVLPLDAVQHIMALAPGQIATLEGRPVLQIDGRPVPLAVLADLLAQGQAVPSTTGRGLALLLGHGERQVACLIDAVLGEQELIIHRLPLPLQRVRCVAGATILADGRVLPILDVVDLVRAAAGPQRPLISTQASAAEQRTPTILVADDSITTRILEKNILTAAGYCVQLVTDGQEALDLLRRMTDENRCDLILSDIDMPRLNGFALTQQVREDPHLRHLPVVLVTSLDSVADRERGVAAGADAYIVKRAFDQQTLLDTIARLL